MSQNKILHNNMTITINEKINLQKVLYLYNLTDIELYKFCKTDKDPKYYTSTRNTLADYIINGCDTNIKIYKKNNCNRYYCNNSLQQLQTDIRNFIYPDNTYDYDIKNCSASIMLYLSKLNNLDYSHIENYVKNRDKFISKYNYTKVELKEIVNKLSNIDNPYLTGKTEIDDFISEFTTNKKKLIEIYKLLLPNKKYDDKKNPISSRYCEIFYYFESQIVQKVMSKYKDDIICYMFDGFNITKQLDLDDLNKITNEYGVEWIVKPIISKFEFNKIVTYDTIKNKLEKYIYKDFILYDILDTYYICEQYNTYISKSIKYCNDLWYVLDSKTNLWKNVKEVQPYFLKILRIGLSNGKSILDKKFQEALDTDDNENIKSIQEKVEKQMKNYTLIDKNSFCGQFKKNITEFITDNEFDNKLDCNMYYFAFKNGIYNMKNKTFRDGIYPTDYLTKTLDFDYSEERNTADMDWYKMELTKIMNNNATHLEFLLSILGQALTGDSEKYKYFYFCIGQLAGNGKSTIFSTLENIFSCYVKCVESNILETDYSKKHKIMPSFKTNRIVYLDEMKKGKKIDSKYVKLIADGKLYENEVLFGTTNTFKIQAKAFLLLNHMTDFDAMDLGVYRRYTHLQFDSEFDVLNKYKLKEDNYEKLKFIPDLKFTDRMIEKKLALTHILLDYAYETYINGIPPMPIEFEEQKELMNDCNAEINEWLETIIYKDSNEKTSKQEIIDRYKSDFNKSIENKEVIDIMKQLGYAKYYNNNTTKNINGVRYRGVYVGVGLEEKSTEYDPFIFSDND